MTWETERSVAGKRPFNWIAIKLNRCRHTYGAGTGSPSSGNCFAQLGVDGDDKCHNSWETCQDRDNFDPRDYWLRFCEAAHDIPLAFDFSNGSPTEEGLDNFIPLLRKFTHDPAMPDPGESLGVRVRFTAQLEDAPHHDIGLDKYALERGFRDSISRAYESHLWQSGVTPSGYTLNQDVAGESTFAVREGPFGDPEVVNVCVSKDTPAGDPGADGGWDIETAIRIDSAAGHLFAVFMKRFTANGQAYWGLHTNSASDVLDLVPAGGGSNTNPYFDFGSVATLFPTPNQWYLVIGYVHATGYAGAEAGISGVYDLDGAKVFDGTEFRWPADATLVRHRCYHYYNTTISTGDEQHMTRPRIIPCTVAEASKIIERLAAGDFDPQTRGSFLRKLKARFPHYVGRSLRWYQGYLTAAPSIADFRCREYVMEKFEGPDAAGRVSIVANDVLRMLDDDRAQCPAKSTGELAADMTAGASITSLEVTTDDLAEYDIASGESAGYVRIGSEIFTYTGTALLSPATGVLLTGVTRAAPSPYSTTAAAHNAGDLVQRCVFLSGTVPAVVRTLMVTYAGVAEGFIPIADWTEEAETWAPESIERLITEPEGVKSIINEIIGQTLTWGFWFDEIDQEIKFQAMRPADIDENIPAFTDDAHIVAGSVQVKDRPDEIVNEVQVLFGQIDPTGDEDDVENYRRGHLDASSDSQSDNELGAERIKKVFARWHPSSNSSVVAQFARRTVNSRSKNVFEVEFQLERKDENVRTAQFCDLTTLYILSALGEARTVRVRVLQVKAEGEAVSYRAREDFFRESFGRLAPGGTSPSDLDGLLWTNATEAQRERYMFLAQADGTFTNGDRGKALA